MALGRDLTVSAAPSPPLWALGTPIDPPILLNLASNAVRYTPSGGVTSRSSATGLWWG